jgi:hypothetical protein
MYKCTKKYIYTYIYIHIHINMEISIELDEKIARLKEEEDLIATDPSVGAVPEMVADRMIGRIIAFFGVPIFGSMYICLHM